MGGCSRSLAEDTGLMSCPARAQGPAPIPGAVLSPRATAGPGQHVHAACSPSLEEDGDRAEPRGWWETSVRHRGIAGVPSPSSQSKVPRRHPSTTPAALTSSGGCRTFCRYFFSTSSGLLPEGEQESEGLEGSMGDTHCWGQWEGTSGTGEPVREGQTGTGVKCLSPFLACFLVVLRQVWEIPGMDWISLLLTGGGCSTSLGGRVRQTGSPAALIRIPVIPG